VSGVAVVRYLLANDDDVTDVVAAAQITAGDLPQGSPMPAITIRQISGVPRLTVAMTEPGRMHTDRVQVTVYVKDQQGYPQGEGYPGLVSIMALALAACPNQRGTINGVIVDSILPDIEGPDLPIPDISVLTRSRDFIVKWKEATP
jgi:hypothetical protein